MYNKFVRGWVWITLLLWHIFASILHVWNTLYSGPIGLFCRIISFYSKRRYMGLTLQYINPIEVLQYQYKGCKSKKKMGLTLQYINPIEVLQYQYKGWKS